MGGGLQISRNGLRTGVGPRLQASASPLWRSRSTISWVHVVPKAHKTQKNTKVNGQKFVHITGRLNPLAPILQYSNQGQLFCLSVSAKLLRTADTVKKASFVFCWLLSILRNLGNPSVFIVSDVSSYLFADHHTCLHLLSILHYFYGRWWCSG